MAYPGETRAHRLLVWLTLGLGALAVAAIGSTIAGLRDDRLAEAAHAREDLAMVLGRAFADSDRSIVRALQQVEIVAHDAEQGAASLRAGLSSPKARRQLADIAERAGTVASIRIVGADGDVLASSGVGLEPPVNLLHDVDFLRLSRSGATFTCVSEPRYEETLHGWALRFARRLETPDGDFLGVMQVTAPLDHYRSIYGAIGAAHGKSLELARRDGAVLVEIPARDGDRHATIPGSPWYDAVSAGGGSYSEADGKGARLVSVYPAPEVPLVVSVSEKESAVLAPWRARALQIGFSAAFALLCATALALAALHKFKGLARSQASLAERGLDLAAFNARLSALLENMPHGVALYGPDRRLTVANRRYADMYGLTPDDARPGALLDDVLAQRIARGIFVEDPAAYVVTRMRDALSGEPMQSVDRLSNGKIFSIVRRPLGDGGWFTVHEDITARQLAEDQIERMALYDQLTGAANRALLLDEMSRRLEGPHAGEAKLALHLVDLDEFKAVNDTHGHPFGDALLRAVVGRLREAVGPRALVARIGGDEFAALQTGGLDERSCAAFAESLLEAIRRPFEIDGVVLSVRPSVGVARAPRDGRDVEGLFKAADLALYCAKSGGRDRIAYFEPKLEHDVRESRALKMEMAEAIALGQFELHYQPIVDARSLETLELEALVRWRHPTRGLVWPDAFIPIAEESGLIHGIGEFVMFRACRDAMALPGDIGVSVNLSPAQFVRGGVVRLVERALAETGLAPHRLTIEITETALMEKLSAGQEILRAIRRMGVNIALDDFGTGYSSLSYLQTFALDKIKIDRAFVAQMAGSERTRNIVALIAAIAQTLGASTVAEGIENSEQLELVVAAGCSAAQGYLIARPAPLATLGLTQPEADSARAA